MNHHRHVENYINPIEQAREYARMMKDFGITQTALAKMNFPYFTVLGTVYEIFNEKPKFPNTCIIVEKRGSERFDKARYKFSRLSPVSLANLLKPP